MATQLFLKMKVKGQMITIIKTQPIESIDEVLKREENWKRTWPRGTIERVVT